VRFSVHEVADRLQEIAASEGLQTERAALEMIARHGTGSMRNSVSLLDQVVADPSQPVTLALVQQVLGAASSAAAVRRLAAALIAGGCPPRGCASSMRRSIRGRIQRQFGQQMVEYLRAVLLAQTAGPELVEASAEDRALFAQQAGQISRGALARALRIFNEAVNSYWRAGSHSSRWSWR
jgi:DNA polymerase-3 subunit gamma/tau